MEEIWKDVIGYENQYQISNLGNFRSCDRYVKTGRNGSGIRFIKGRILTPCKCKNGYLECSLNYKQERRVYLLHRLVAIHFIPNPENLPEVNHKDENIENNCVDNLEWCTSKYNANYGSRNQRVGDTKLQKGLCVSVDQYTRDGVFIKRWKKMADACNETGSDISSMIRVCKGKQKSSVGYIWRYVNNGEDNQLQSSTADRI